MHIVGFPGLSLVLSSCDECLPMMIIMVGTLAVFSTYVFLWRLDEAHPPSVSHLTLDTGCWVQLGPLRESRRGNNVHVYEFLIILIGF